MWGDTHNFRGGFHMQRGEREGEDRGSTNLDTAAYGCRLELPPRSDDWREGFPSGMSLRCLWCGRGDQLPSVASCRNRPERLQGNFWTKQELLATVRHRYSNGLRTAVVSTRRGMRV